MGEADWGNGAVLLVLIILQFHVSVLAAEHGAPQRDVVVEDYDAEQRRAVGPRRLTHRLEAHVARFRDTLADEGRGRVDLGRSRARASAASALPHSDGTAAATRGWPWSAGGGGGRGRARLASVEVSTEHILALLQNFGLHPIVHSSKTASYYLANQCFNELPRRAPPSGASWTRPLPAPCRRLQPRSTGGGRERTGRRAWPSSRRTTTTSSARWAAAAPTA